MQPELYSFWRLEETLKLSFVSRENIGDLRLWSFSRGLTKQVILSRLCNSPSYFLSFSLKRGKQ